MTAAGGEAIEAGAAGVGKERGRGNGFGNWTRLFRVENDDEEEGEDCKKRKYWRGREESEGRDKGLIRQNRQSVLPPSHT